MSISVTVKTLGDWQTSIEKGAPRDPDPNEGALWVLVDIGRDPDASSAYYVVSQWWMEDSIYREHKEYLGSRSR